MRWFLPLPLLACNADPTDRVSEVGYRSGLEVGEPNSGERGVVKISEVFWSGSVDAGGDWDAADVFVELRNEGSRSLNLSGWRLVLEGPLTRTWLLPPSDREVLVSEHVFIAAKTSGCFPEPDYVVPGLEFAFGDAFKLTLLDSDERLIEPVGNDEALPFAGSFDGVVSRSMERAELMFGGDGTFPHTWHHYTEDVVEIPNNDRIAEGCREGTLASPGRANSPDYSGSFASGSFE